jgi:SSS family solute:Na+ symporter
MIVLGFAPVVYLGLKDVGGYGALTNALKSVATDPSSVHLRDPGISYGPNAWTSAWHTLLSGPANNPMGVDWFAMVFGLGFVLSFGYWCTNFLVVQRAMAARNMTAARNTPLVAAVPKMLFPALVILPGMIAVALMTIPSKGYKIPAPILDNSAYERAMSAVAADAALPPEQAFKDISAAVGKKMDAEKVAALVRDYAAKPLAPEAFRDRLWNAVAEYDYDGVILSLVKRYCPPGLLGLALTGLLASFMSGMAGNVTAFNTVWTYDLYQAYMAPNKSDEHYMRMGQVITLVGILLSIACAYFASMYNNAMDIIQLVFAFVNAPLFATFLLGMFWKRTTGTGAFLGLLLGTATSGLVHALTISQGNVPGLKGGYLSVVHTFPSEMAQNFWLAIFAFIVCFGLTAGISLATARTKSDDELKGLVYSLTPKIKDEGQAWFQRPAVLGTALLAACVVLNLIFW